MVNFRLPKFTLRSTAKKFHLLRRFSSGLKLLIAAGTAVCDDRLELLNPHHHHSDCHQCHRSSPPIVALFPKRLTTPDDPHYGHKHLRLIQDNSDALPFNASTTCTDHHTIRR
ncbi:uncharacterized protein LOC118201628 isoform X1 [Stegodyphus dumicola]|uniref:uncharacterized protein LOC118201628 isoform X1 n=1 Tax=Stegodyphus dumicola TaxID=202533 RepID=UPI0015B2E2FA|nr:uncharacterized protein LOC118201628 isoform X1 [Stegodyphus dumicola]